MDKHLKANRKFGLMTGVAFIIIAAYSFLKQGIIYKPLLIIAIILLLAAMIFPQKLTLFRKFWEKLGELLGHVNTIILLTTVYFIILAPIGYIMRLLKKDPLKLKVDPSLETYWEDHLTDNEDVYQQF